MADKQPLSALSERLDALFILDKNARQSFDDIHATNPNFLKIGILVGPEGGLSPLELEYWSSFKNSYLVKLGPRILRADTAAIVSLALSQALWGDLS